MRKAKDYIARRQLKWIQKLASKHVNDVNEDIFNPSKLLFSWSKNSRGVGHPQRNLRDAYQENLKLLYPVNPNKFATWKQDIISGEFENKIEIWWSKTAPRTAIP